MTRQIVVSPNYAVDQTLFVVSLAGLFRSTDAGATWQRVYTGTPYSIAFSPAYATDRSIFLATSGGEALLRSQNGGTSWSALNNGIRSTVIYSLAVSPGFATDRTIYAVGDAVYLTTNGGASWVKLGAAQPVGGTAIKLSPNFRTDRTVFVAGSGDGIWRSQDSGASWRQVGSELNGAIPYEVFVSPVGAQGYTILVATADAIWRSRNAGTSWSKLPLSIAGFEEFGTDGSIAFAPNFQSEPLIVAGSQDGDGVFRSTNGGDTWAMSNTGIVAQSTRLIRLSPNFAHDGIMLAEGGANLHRSADRGASWRQVGEGFGDFRLSDIELSPNFARDRLAFYTNIGLYRSSDGGASWGSPRAAARAEEADGPVPFTSGAFDHAGAAQPDPLVEQTTPAQPAAGPEPDLTISSAVDSVALSPAFATDRTVFANQVGYFSAEDGGLLRSTDGGLRFTRIGPDVGDLTISPAFATDRTMFAAGGGIHRSTTAGVSWATVFSFGANASNTTIFDLALAPTFAQDGLALAGTNSWLLRSTDGGANWSVIRNQRARAIAFSPAYAQDRVIYAGFDDGIYRSTDAGSSWSLFAALPQGSLVNDIVVDPRDPGRLLIGTGSGVWVNDGPSGSEGVISGTIRDSRGQLLDNVTVAVINTDGSEPPLEVRAAGGIYTARGLSAGATYIVRPRLPGHFFDPPSAILVARGNTTRDFAGTQGARPVIFIPGILGSYLDEYPDAPNSFTRKDSRWPFGLFKERLTLNRNSPNYTNKIYANDAIRFKPDGGGVYGPFLEDLVDPEVGYIEYPVNGDPRRRVTCQANNQPDRPNLFVFAYDWRQSNTSSADMLRQYVDCIRTIYGQPTLRVNMVAHSMGGLVARRFIMDNPDAVDRLATVASPWLGSPEAIANILFGDSIWFVIGREQYQELVADFTGAHELLPTSAYYQIGVAPFEEVTWDANQNDRIDGVYTHSQLVGMMNTQLERSRPGTAVVQFHGYRPWAAQSGQDIWLGDTSGVQYLHIVGRRGINDTEMAFEAHSGEVCTVNTGSVRLGCSNRDYLNTIYGAGDTTVPTASAARRGVSLDFNTPDATIIECRPQLTLFGDDQDSVKHDRLVDNTEVRAYLLAFLNGEALTPSVNCAELPRAGGQLQSTAADPAYYLHATNTITLTVTDGQGNSTQPPNDGVPQVSVYTLGVQDVEVIAPTTTTYTVTFTVGDLPIALAVTRGDGTNWDLAARYLDLSLPAGVTAQLRLTPAGVESLRYDANGDGNFETMVTPSVSLSGTSANDVTPPELTHTATGGPAVRRLALSATDTGAGVDTIYYSLDGQVFFPYSEPITVDITQQPVIYAFSDDRAGNRSGTYHIRLIEQMYLPLLRR